MLWYKQDREILRGVFLTEVMHAKPFVLWNRVVRLCGNNSRTVSVRLNFIAGVMLLFPLKMFSRPRMMLNLFCYAFTPKHVCVLREMQWIEGENKYCH